MLFHDVILQMGQAGRQAGRGRQGGERQSKARQVRPE